MWNLGRAKISDAKFNLFHRPLYFLSSLYMIMKQFFFVLLVNYRVFAFKLFLQITQPRNTDLSSALPIERRSQTSLFFILVLPKKPNAREHYKSVRRSNEF